MAEETKRTRDLKKICVFSGSKSGKNENYTTQTRTFAELMLKHHLTLVYGGGTIGLMGTMSKTIHEGGGRVIGVIPKSLAPREVSGEAVGEQVIVNSMHERKLKVPQETSTKTL